MRINWRLIAFWTTLFWLVYLWPTEGEEKHIIRKPIEVTTHTAMCFVPCTVRVTIRLEHHSDNRWIGFWWGDLGGFAEEGSEMLQLDGEHDDAPYHREITFRSDGNMMFLSTVGRVDQRGKKSDHTAWVKIQVGSSDNKGGKKGGQ